MATDIQESETKGGEAIPVLTQRQREVLSLLRFGKSNKEIARVLDISVATVNTHINAIYRALNVDNRSKAVHVAMEMGILGAATSASENDG